MCLYFIPRYFVHTRSENSISPFDIAVNRLALEDYHLTSICHFMTHLIAPRDRSIKMIRAREQGDVFNELSIRNFLFSGEKPADQRQKK